MNRLMRILVMFDLPVKTKAERRSATQFGIFVGDGYHMVQYSVRPYLQRPGFRGDPQEKNSAGASIKGLCADANDH